MALTEEETEMITLETGAEVEIPETKARTGSLETGIGADTIEAGPGHEIDQEAEEETVIEEAVCPSEIEAGGTSPLGQV